MSSTPTRGRRYPSLAAALASSCLLLPGTAAPAETGAAQRGQILHAYANLPLTLVENRGQTDPRVQFVARGARHAVFVTADGIVLSLSKQPASEARPAGGDLVATAANAR